MNTTAADIAQNLLGRIVHEFTFRHEHLKIWCEPMGRVQIIYMQVHKADMPRVIGKVGAHRMALFNLVQLIGKRYSAELRYENVEPETGQVERYAPFKPAIKWDSRPVVQLVKDICAATLMFQVQVECVDSGHTPTSTVQVVVGNQEDVQSALVLTECLKVLVNAIGKARGRILMVDVISQSELARMKSVKV